MQDNTCGRDVVAVEQLRADGLKDIAGSSMSPHMQRVGSGYSMHRTPDGRTIVVTIVSRLPERPWWGLQVDVAAQLMAAGPDGILVLVSVDNTLYFDGIELVKILANLVPQSGGRLYHLNLGLLS